MKAIRGGVYLVIDPRQPEDILLQKLRSALRGGLAAVQVWDAADFTPENHASLRKISSLCREQGVPALINNRWDLLDLCGFDGVHFDAIPPDYPAIKKQVKRDFITGITCGNERQPLAWAIRNTVSYISFCAMFPSASAGSCTIVMPQAVRRARQQTAMPIFVSGGMDPENTARLLTMIRFDGVAVISGIMNAADPQAQVEAYRNALQSLKTDEKRNDR